LRANPFDLDAALEFRILRPLEVLKDGVPVRLGGLKQRATLAILLLHANRAARSTGSAVTVGAPALTKSQSTPGLSFF
jgi:hypothetical protein